MIKKGTKTEKHTKSTHYRNPKLSAVHQKAHDIQKKSKKILTLHQKID